MQLSTGSADRPAHVSPYDCSEPSVQLVENANEDASQSLSPPNWTVKSSVVRPSDYSEQKEMASETSDLLQDNFMGGAEQPAMELMETIYENDLMLVEDQSVSNNEQAIAALATLSRDELIGFVQGIFCSDEFDSNVMRSHLAAFLSANPREEAELSHETIQQQAREEADNKVQVAVQSIREAAQQMQGDVHAAEALRHACEQLEARTTPLARGAAKAERMIHNILNCCPPGMQKMMKKADRCVRDVVVLRCRVCCEDPKDRHGFLAKAAEAYDGQLDHTVRAQLLLAYHKDPLNQKCGFASNNQIAADRRGGPRCRRRRHSPNRDTGAGDSHHQAQYALVDSGCTRSIISGKNSDEPMYVQPPKHDDDNDADWVVVAPHDWKEYGWPDKPVGPRGLHAEKDKEVTVTTKCTAGHPQWRNRGGQPHPAYQHTSSCQQQTWPQASTMQSIGYGPPSHHSAIGNYDMSIYPSMSGMLLGKMCAYFKCRQVGSFGDPFCRIH